jgi:hypothetical protein
LTGSGYQTIVYFDGEQGVHAERQNELFKQTSTLLPKLESDPSILRLVMGTKDYLPMRLR